MRYLAALSLAAFAPFFLPALRSAPANDNIQNAIGLSANQLVNRTNGNVTGVTADGLTILLPGSQTPTSGYLFPAVWYKWTAPVKGTVSIQGVGKNFNMWGTTLIGPLGQDVYTVAGTDASTTIYSAILSTMSYTYETQPGVTYYNAIECYFVNNPNSYSYIHSFTQSTLSDSFAERTQMGGVDFTVFGNNATYTVEEGEPTQPSAANHSVWTTWRSPDSRKAVTLQATAKFSPVIAVYTGDSLGTLKLVARSSSNSASGDGISSSASFVAEDGVDYHIAIDGTGTGSGAFSLKLKAATVRPGFITSPVATTVRQTETATFTASAAYTGDTITYQWQRMPADGKQWITLADDATFTGTQTSALSVITSLDMNNDRYRVLATDVVGTSASRASLLTVTEFAPVLTEILGTVGGVATGVINLSLGAIPEPTNGGVYYAVGLPKGLSINPETGEITGVIDAKAGTYRVTYGSTNGKKKNPETYIVQIVVSPLSTYIAGSFESLIDSLGTLASPQGKISLKVAGNGRFTGTYFDLAEGKTYPFSSTLVLNQETRTATNPSTAPIRIARGNRPPLFMDISIVEPSIVDDQVIGSTVVSSLLYDSTDTILGQAADGAPVSRFTAANLAPWAGRYTLRLQNDSFIPAPGGGTPDLPIGSGHATGTIVDKTGILSLRGLLPDNTLFTASLASSPDATYRLGQRLYGAAGGKLAGRINLDPQVGTDSTTTLAYHSDEFSQSILHWTKPARASDKLYPAGFDGGILPAKVFMEPWANPNGQIAASLGLTAGGRMKIEIAADVPQDGNDTNAYGLPVEVSLNPNGTISLVSPSTNPTQFALQITPLTGAFTGSYQLAEPDAAPKAKPRKVTFSGVLLQNRVVFFGDTIGSGFAIVPPLAAGEKNTAASVKFLAGQPESPFDLPVDNR